MIMRCRQIVSLLKAVMLSEPLSGKAVWLSIRTMKKKQCQKVFGPARDLVPEQQGRVEEETLDDILASYDCGYTVSGTVTSAVEENGFSFRVDDGGGFIENGTELRVSTAFVERRLYGMKGLQWWMDGVIVGFSDLPAEGVLRAKVIVGNDDTSSDYWENMPAS